MKKRMFLVSLLAIAMGYSCQNEFVGMEDSSNAVLTRSVGEELSVASAKEYFEANIHKLEVPGAYASEQHSECDSEHCTHNHDCDDCELHNHDSDEALSHDHAPNKAHRVFESNHLPELKKSNIVLEWDKSYTWNDAHASYVEVPMNMGGQIFALKKEQKAGKIINHERSRTNCALIFQKDNNRIYCYVSTFVREKKYKQKKNITYRTLKEDKFTGIVFISETNGNTISGFRYEDGKITSKLKKAINVTDTSHITAVTLFDMSVNKAMYDTDWERQCMACGQYHEAWEDCYTSDCYCGNPHCGCSNCHCAVCQCCKECGAVNNTCFYCGACKCLCRCCPYCNSDPCECYICKKCWREPCVCPK